MLNFIPTQFRKHRYQKLSYQLSLNILLTILVMIILIGGSVAYFVADLIEQDVSSRLLTEGKAASFQVQTRFDNSAILVKQMSLDLTIQSYLKAVKTRQDIKDNSEFNRVLSTLRAIQSSDQQVFLAWIANQKANFYLDSQGVIPDDTYDVAKRPWYSVAMDKPGVNYTEPYVEWGTGNMVVSAIQALYDEGKNYGFAVVDFDLAILPDVVNAINVGAKGQVYIVDENGNFIYHPDENKVLKENLMTEEENLGKYFESLSQDDKEMVDPLVKRNIQTLKVHNETYYVNSLKIKQTKWTMIILVNKQEELQNLFNLLIILGTVLIIVTIISLVIINKIIQSKIAPISALQSYGAQIANGNLEQEPPYVYTQRSDEMGDLARSFVTITEVFKQKNAFLEEVVTSQYEEIQKQYHYILEKEKIASLGALVAGVAHEINTPLGVGVTAASFIETILKQVQQAFHEKRLSEGDFTSQMETLLEASLLLQKNLKRAADLVQQFKSVATNQNSEHLGPVALYTELNNVIASLKPTFKHRKIEIINEVEPELVMTSFVGALTQVFTNLIMNSMYHGFGENDEGIIRISATREGELVRLNYLDNGKGMSQDVLDHLIEPFFTTRRAEGNSGLGMYITHNLVTQSLNGTLQIVSQLGQGVNFKIVLPLNLELETETMIKD